MAEPSIETKANPSTDGLTAPPPAPTGPRTYTEDEVNDRLRGQGKRLKELEAQAKELSELKAAKASADEESAKKRGEFEKLYSEEKKAREALAAEAATHKKAAEAYEELLQGEVKAGIEALPETIRGEAKASLKGLPLLEQRKLLSLLAKAGGGTTPPAPPPGGGPPGPPRKGTPPTPLELKNNPQLATELALARLEERRRARGA